MLLQAASSSHLRFSHSGPCLRNHLSTYMEEAYDFWVTATDRLWQALRTSEKQLLLIKGNSENVHIPTTEADRGPLGA